MSDFIHHSKYTAFECFILFLRMFTFRWSRCLMPFEEFISHFSGYHLAASLHILKEIKLFTFSYHLMLILYELKKIKQWKMYQFEQTESTDNVLYKSANDVFRLSVFRRFEIFDKRLPWIKYCIFLNVAVFITSCGRTNIWLLGPSINIPDRNDV